MTPDGFLLRSLLDGAKFQPKRRPPPIFSSSFQFRITEENKLPFLFELFVRFAQVIASTSFNSTVFSSKEGQDENSLQTMNFSFFFPIKSHGIYRSSQKY